MLVIFFVGLSVLISLVMIIQQLLNIFFKLYSWSTKERFQRANFLADFENNNLKAHGPREGTNLCTSGTRGRFTQPMRSFSLLIPARHEEKVIRETILRASKINYPKNLFEILVVCEEDDLTTIFEVQRAICDPQSSNVNLVTFSDQPICKPHALNVGFSKSSKELIGVFDAEDDIHPDILNLANSIFSTEDVDVLQSGVQLIDFDSRWFSSLNVLEYYFWFKSRLNFFADLGVVPLGGNTVFFKREILQQASGWDETCLTEDAEIGVRLSVTGAKTRVVYADEFVTREETPKTVSEFVKQRTRWNQGFLQVLKKGEFYKLPTLSLKLAAIYTFVNPLTVTATSVFLPLVLLKLLDLSLPVPLAMFLIFPIYPSLFELVINAVGLFEFGKSFNQKIHFKFYLLLFLAFFPYQMMLSWASLRAFWREAIGQTDWEKTTHFGFHRVPQGPTVEFAEGRIGLR